MAGHEAEEDRETILLRNITMKKIKDKESTIFFLEDPSSGDLKESPQIRIHVEGAPRNIVLLLLIALMQDIELEEMVEESLRLLNTARREGKLEDFKKETSAIHLSKDEFYKD